MRDPVSRTAVAEEATLRALATGKSVRSLPTNIGQTVTRKTVKRTVKRGLLSTVRQEARRTIITEHYARDEFGELAGRKREATKLARDNGHQLGSWHKRPSDSYGRQNAFCVDCNAITVVCIEDVPGFPLIYGNALTRKCDR